MKLSLQGRTVWINFHHLYCFYVIAAEGGLAAASRKLGVGASALSIQMKQFESALETSLFHRSHRKLELSEPGRVVFAYAREIFRLGGEMFETLRDRPSARQVHLEIGAIDGVPKHVTAELVEMAVANQNCSVTVNEGRPSALWRDLLRHRIDLMLTNSVPKTKPGAVYLRRIAKLPLLIVGGASFESLKKNYPESLSGRPFVLPTQDSRLRQEVSDYFRQNRIRVDVRVEAQDIMTQKILAIRNLGLTVLPEFAVREYLIRGEMYVLGRLPESHYEEIFLAAAERKIQNPVADQIMKSYQVR